MRITMPPLILIDDDEIDRVLNMPLLETFGISTTNNKTLARQVFYSTFKYTNRLIGLANKYGYKLEVEAVHPKNAKYEPGERYRISLSYKVIGIDPKEVSPEFKVDLKKEQLRFAQESLYQQVRLENELFVERLAVKLNRFKRLNDLMSLNTIAEMSAECFSRNSKKAKPRMICRKYLRQYLSNPNRVASAKKQFESSQLFVEFRANFISEIQRLSVLLDISFIEFKYQTVKYIEDQIKQQKVI